MQGRELERLIRQHLLPALPGFDVHGGHVFLTPIGNVLQAVVFEPSGFARDIRRIHYAVLPLYTPDHHFFLTFSRILGGAHSGKGDRWWEFPPDDRTQAFCEIARLIVADALPWLKRFGSPAALAESAGGIVANPGDPHVIQQIALSRLLIGQTELAIAGLREAARVARADTFQPRPEWLVKLAMEADDLADLAEQRPSEALGRLANWRSETLATLRLSPWAATGDYR